MALILQEVSDGARDRDPGRGARHLQALAPDAALPRATGSSRRSGRSRGSSTSTRASARPGSHKPNTAVAQAFYNKQEGRDAPRDRDRRRPVGQRARVRVQADRARVQGLHGQGLVRAEAVPALADADVGRGGRREPVRRDARRAARSSRSTPTRRAASGSRSPRRSRTRPAATTPRTRSAACSTTCCCTRR